MSTPHREVRVGVWSTLARAHTQRCNSPASASRSSAQRPPLRPGPDAPRCGESGARRDPADGRGPSPPGWTAAVRRRSCASAGSVLPRGPVPRVPSPRPPPHLAVPSRARSLAAQRMRKSGAEGGNRAERNVCGRLSDSDSGGRPDSCQTVPACPLPPFRKGLETSRAAGAPSAPPLPHPFGSKGQRLPGRG